MKLLLHQFQYAYTYVAIWSAQVHLRRDLIKKIQVLHTRLRNNLHIIKLHASKNRAKFSTGTIELLDMT